MSQQWKLVFILVIFLQILSVWTSSLPHKRIIKHPRRISRRDFLPNKWNTTLLRRIETDSADGEDNSDEILDEEQISRTYAVPEMNTKYLPYNSCGQNLQCQVGVQGPCYRNEVYVVKRVQRPRMSCRNSRPSVYNGCIPSIPVAPQPPVQGTCVLRNPSRPCIGYTPDYRYCPEVKRCYSVAQPPPVNPCGPTKVLKEVNQQYATCVCKEKNYVVSKGDNQCYPAYTQAQCPQGQWIVPQTRKYGVCVPCPCPEYADGQHIYLGGQRPGCYKSYTQGPCHTGQVLYIADYVQPKVQCIPVQYPPVVEQPDDYQPLPDYVPPLLPSRPVPLPEPLDPLEFVFPDFMPPMAQGMVPGRPMLQVPEDWDFQSE